MSDFIVPEHFLNQHVQVNFNIPVPGPGGRGVGFLGIEGRLVESLMGSLVLEVGADKVVVPKANVQSITRKSSIAAGSPLDLASLARREQS